MRRAGWPCDAGRLLGFLLVGFFGVPTLDAHQPPAATDRYETLRVTGRVGWLADAVRERFGMEVAADARERVLGITTTSGEVLPLLEDSRGRAFRLDASCATAAATAPR